MNIWVDDIDTRIVLLIRAVRKQGGFPTFPMLCDELGLAKSSLHDRLRRLRSLGLVEWDDGKHGTLHAPIRLLKLP